MIQAVTTQEDESTTEAIIPHGEPGWTPRANYLSERGTDGVKFKVHVGAMCLRHLLGLEFESQANSRIDAYESAAKAIPEIAQAEKDAEALEARKDDYQSRIEKLKPELQDAVDRHAESLRSDNDELVTSARELVKTRSERLSALQDELLKVSELAGQARTRHTSAEKRLLGSFRNHASNQLESEHAAKLNAFINMVGAKPDLCEMLVELCAIATTHGKVQHDLRIAYEMRNLT